MHPFEMLFLFLFVSDILWGALVAGYLLIALPISYLIIRKRDRK